MRFPSVIQALCQNCGAVSEGETLANCEYCVAPLSEKNVEVFHAQKYRHRKPEDDQKPKAESHE